MRLVLVQQKINKVLFKFRKQQGAEDTIKKPIDDIVAAD